MQRTRFFQMVKDALHNCGFVGEIRIVHDDDENYAEAVGWVGEPGGNDASCEIRFVPLAAILGEPTRRER